jgi:hypothetical protein
VAGSFPAFTLLDDVCQSRFDDWTLAVINYFNFIPVHIDTGDIKAAIRQTSCRHEVHLTVTDGSASVGAMGPWGWRGATEVEKQTGGPDAMPPSTHCSLLA